jgi:hypothetical protein
MVPLIRGCAVDKFRNRGEQCWQGWRSEELGGFHGQLQGGKIKF